MDGGGRGRRPLFMLERLILTEEAIRDIEEAIADIGRESLYDGRVEAEAGACLNALYGNQDRKSPRKPETTPSQDRYEDRRSRRENSR